MTEAPEARQVSRPLRIAGRFLRRSWQGIVVLLLAVALGVAAYLSPGLVQADVRLDEGTVYAGKRDSGMVGSVNAQIDEIANGTPVGSLEFNLLQHEDLVLVQGIESPTVSQYFPGRNSLGAPTLVPDNAHLQLVGETLLVVNPNNGRAWFGPAETVLAYDFREEKAHLETGEFGVATLTTEGNVIGLDPTRSVLVRLGPEGPVTTALPFQLDPDRADLEISAVGETAVVLDRDSGRLWVEGMKDVFEVEDGATLMAPAPDALGGEDGIKAIYSSQAGLIAVTSGGQENLTGELRLSPVQPVQLGECVYAAFGNQFFKKCRGADIAQQEIPELGAGAELSFQVNRTTVSLNDITTGAVWLVDKDMTLITDWQRVLPREDDETTEEITRDNVVEPDRPEENRPPVAQDDTLSARAGRSTILNVLDNDYDPDGDVLTISALSKLDGASLQPVRGGAGLQISINPGTVGPLTFSYTINDGRPGGTATANVTLRVAPADPGPENKAPYRYEEAKPLLISQGQTLTKRVLLDWRDPEGDPLVLKGASLPAGAEDILRFTPDGTITFIDVGKSTGRKVVDVVISDGYVETAGELEIEVSEEIVAPIAFGDFATTTVGKTVTVEPLANDVANLPTLMNAETDCDQCELEVNTGQGTVKFTAPTAGIYYVTYSVSNGIPATGLIRIDVTEEGTRNPPIPALDVALLPQRGSVVIDPLLNDTDADGDVLVIQQLSQHPALKIVMERRHMVSISADFTPTEPIRLSYRVSDGTFTGCQLEDGTGDIPCGTIIVMPAPSEGSIEPAALDDEVRVRAGTSGVADVLLNDVSPIGLDLELTRLVDHPFGDRAWIDGDRIRVSVPPGAASATSTITYEVRDSEGKTDSARLSVTVVSEDAQNEPPLPRDVVDRVLAGTRTAIPINLTGIDPNGDAVRLLGLASGPQLGRIVEVGDGYLLYESFEGSTGTDTFSYQVIDSLGLTATGEIRIGVALPNPDNAPPTGVTDSILVRPGRHVQFSPTDNDFDIDGDAVRLSSSEQVQMDGGIAAEIIEGREIAMTAPAEPGTYVGKYFVTDSRQMPGYGDIILTVDEEAPLLAPVLRDDTVPTSELDQEFVSVDVLANDYDPDGPKDQLVIEVPPTDDDPARSARLSDDGTRVVVPVLDTMQQVRYLVHDGDENTSVGVIVVPGRGDARPELIDPKVHRDAVAGQPVMIEINEYVAGTAGRSVELTIADNISTPANHGHAIPRSLDTIEYVPSAQYEGESSVVFEVKDVLEGDEKSAKTAFITIPFTVHPALDAPEVGEGEDTRRANRPPEALVNEPILRVAPGEPAVHLDLKPLFKDPEGQDFNVEFLREQGGDADLSWDIEGSRVSASAPLQAKPGTERVLTGQMIDASEGRTPFTVRLQIIQSTRPKITTVADIVPEAVAGSEVVIPVTVNDKSYLEDDRVVLLNDVAVLTGAASITAQPAAGTVTIRPTTGSHGPITARYTVVDATGDLSRRVEGTIRVTVQDAPADPLTPYDVTPGDGLITFKYVLPHDGGSEITESKVIATSPGQPSREGTCVTTACSVGGLKNGVPWQVQVVVRNKIDVATSPLSMAVVPDARPAPPVISGVTYGDSELTVSWDPGGWTSQYGGSAVTHYVVQLWDAETGGKIADSPTVAAGGTSSRSYTWGGLTNGHRYQFTVLAYSSFHAPGNPSNKLPSEPSRPSAIEFPSRAPSGNLTPTVTPMQNTIGGGFTVTFAKALIDDGGAPITEYVAQPIFEGGGSGELISLSPPAGDTVSFTFQNLGVRGTRFVVFARNRSSGQSPTRVGQSAEWLIAYPLPQIDNVEAEAGDGQVQFAITSNVGEYPVTYHYRIGTGSYQPLDSSQVVSGLTNGELYSFTLQARINGMTSADWPVSNLRPRSAEPAGVDIGSVQRYLVGDDGIQLTFPEKTWTSSGGWDPERYSYCVDSETRVSKACRNFSNSPVMTREPGREYYFAWAWGRSDGESYGGTDTLTLPSVATPSYSGGRLNFSFPYVEQGECVVSDAANGTVIDTLTHGGGATFERSVSVVYQDLTDPAVPKDVIPQSVTVACTINNWSKTYTS